MAKRRTFWFADGHSVEAESPPEELVLEWTLQNAGWSKEEIASLNPNRDHLLEFFDKGSFYANVEKGLMAFMNRRLDNHQSAYDYRRHIVWKRLDENYQNIKAKLEPEFIGGEKRPPEDPAEPPEPIRFSAEKFTTARGNKRLTEGTFAKYKYTYELQPIDVSFGKVAKRMVRGKRIVHKEFLGLVSMADDAIAAQITKAPELLTRSAKKVFKKEYVLL